MKYVYANIAAATAATIWGIFFLVAKISLLDLSVFNIIAYRYILACIPFFILVFVRSHILDRKIIRNGIILGIILFVADFFQLTGISLTTVSSSALLSQGLIIFTPIFLLFLGTKVKKFDFLRAAIAFVGIYLFVVKDALLVSTGDLLVLGFAVVISIYFIVNEKFVKKSSLIGLLSVQFLTEGLIGLAFSVFIVGLSYPATPISWLPILYLGFAATALAWGLSSLAQKTLQSHHVVLIYVLEPLVAGFLAFVFFSESLMPKELLGAIIILFAIIMPVLGNWKMKKKY